MNSPVSLRACSPRIEPLEARIAPALLTTLTWQGDLATAGWDDGTVNTNTNWLSNLAAHKIPVDGNILVFPAGAANKTNNNDLTGLDLRSLSFTDVGYDITGNAITLSGGITANVAAAGTNAFHPTITLAADQTFSSTSNAGAVFEFDTIDLGGHSLTVDGPFTVKLGTTTGTKLTGAGTLIKNGTGPLQLSRANDFTGPVQVNAGVVIVSNDDGLGAAGAGNGTTIASGASVTFGLVSNVPESFTLSGTGAAGQTGAIVATSSVLLTGVLRLGSDATIAAGAGFGPKITLANTVGAADDALAILTVNSPALDGCAFLASATLTTELAGTTPGAGGHDQLKVFGKVDLGNAALDVVPSFSPQVGDKFKIVDNDGVEAITGTFAGKAQGSTFTAGGVNFTILYTGGDGNDVELTVASLVNPPLPVTLSADGKTATFIDTDGDNVTVKTTKGPFQQNDFSGVAQGVAGGGQLQQINLTTHAADFKGAGITISAKPGPLGGNGFVNVGYVNATGIDLGVVKIGGDLGRINAGTVGGDVKVPAIKSLDVASVGLLGTSTQAAGGIADSRIEGALPKLSVKGDIRDVKLFMNGATDGILGNATIGGSLVNTAVAGQLIISAGAGIGTMKIGGDLRDNATGGVTIASSGTIGAITIGGSIVGDDPAAPVSISAFGKLPAPTAGLDLAIKSVTVRGSVENASIDAGGVSTPNADASIGAITVGGDWIASRVTAGIVTGADGKIGTDDDAKPVFAGTRDNPAIFSSISSFTVKGQALGTEGTGDMFGVVAERIGKAKVGGRTFAFTNGATPEAFFAAPTSPGKGTENPAFDFTIRELGSTTPVPAFGGSNLSISTDGKTATFIDVDGDEVTVKRSAGAFVAGDFSITDNASGGGQLTQLILSAAPGGAVYDVSITARPGPDGGNGFVNVGFVAAFGLGALGKLSVAGDLGSFNITGGLFDKPAVTAFTAHSLGQLGTSTGATQNAFDFSGSVPKFTVAGDVRGASIIVLDSANLPGMSKGFIGGSLIGGATADAGHISVGVIGSLKIGGSVRSGAGASSGTIEASASIGSIAIGGDLVGSAAVPVEIKARGIVPRPATAPDFALKSLVVKGGVERLLMTIGKNLNPDAALGTLSVGREWQASSVIVGGNAGADTFIGTADDAKSPTGPDVAERFSSIASILIKGQALGTAAAGDHFGIVAEQILKAKIGARTFTFTKGARDAADAFAAAPTGPGPAPDNAASDFFLREITV